MMIESWRMVNFMSLDYMGMNSIGWNDGTELQSRGIWPGQAMFIQNSIDNVTRTYQRRDTTNKRWS